MTDEHDPRLARWRRVLRFPPLRLALLGGALFLILGTSNGFVLRLAGEPWAAIAVVAAMAALALAVYAGFVRFVEGRPVAELSPAGMGQDLGLGLLVGAGLYTACVAVLMALGFYRIDGLNPLAFMLPAVAMALGSGIFSGIVSGSDSDPGLLRSTIAGPPLLTGGSFGLEASLIAFLFCTATGVLLLVMAVRRGQVVPPAWRRFP